MDSSSSARMISFAASSRRSNFVCFSFSSSSRSRLRLLRRPNVLIFSWSSLRTSTSSSCDEAARARRVSENVAVSAASSGCERVCDAARQHLLRRHGATRPAAPPDRRALKVACVRCTCRRPPFLCLGSLRGLLASLNEARLIRRTSHKRINGATSASKARARRARSVCQSVHQSCKKVPPPPSPSS